MVHSKCCLKESPSSQPFSCAMAALAPITNLQCAEFWHNKYWWEERASLEALAKRFRPGLILRRRVPWQQRPRTRRLGLFLWPICWMPNTWCFVKIKLLKVAFFFKGTPAPAQPDSQHNSCPCLSRRSQCPNWPLWNDQLPRRGQRRHVLKFFVWVSAEPVKEMSQIFFFAVALLNVFSLASLLRRGRGVRRRMRTVRPSYGWFWFMQGHQVGWAVIWFIQVIRTHALHVFLRALCVWWRQLCTNPRSLGRRWICMSISTKKNSFHVPCWLQPTCQLPHYGWIFNRKIAFFKVPFQRCKPLNLKVVLTWGENICSLFLFDIHF